MAHPLKAYRETAQISQEEFAHRLGVGRSAVARWETGARKIETSLIPKISAMTGIPAKELRPDLAELMGEDQ